jgi:hypothetical protein
MLTDYPVIGVLRTRLQDWVAGAEFKGDLTLLRLLVVIVKYEMNRTYELWYGQIIQFEKKEYDNALDDLPDDLTELKEGLRTYARRACERENANHTPPIAS